MCVCVCVRVCVCVCVRAWVRGVRVGGRVGRWVAFAYVHLCREFLHVHSYISICVSRYMRTYVYVCYVCACAYVGVVYACMCTYVCMRVCVRMHAPMREYTYVNGLLACPCLYMRVCMYCMCVWICVYVCTVYVNVCLYVCIYVCVCMCIRVCLCMHDQRRPRQFPSTTGAQYR